MILMPIVTGRDLTEKVLLVRYGKDFTDYHYNLSRTGKGFTEYTYPQWLPQVLNDIQRILMNGTTEYHILLYSNLSTSGKDSQNNKPFEDYEDQLNTTLLQD